MDELKNKIKNGPKSAVHTQLINAEPSPKRKRTPKPKFEETHGRRTFWIRKDLMLKIDEEISAERGAMTVIINELLDEYFKET
jgi:hypothetical protein